MPIPFILPAIMAALPTAGAAAGAGAATAAGAAAAGTAAGAGAATGAGLLGSFNALAGAGLPASTGLGLLEGLTGPAAAGGGGLLAGLGSLGKNLIPSLLSSSSVSFGNRNFSATIGDPRSRMIQQLLQGQLGGGRNPSVITRTGNQKEDPFSMLGRLIAPRFQFQL